MTLLVTAAEAWANAVGGLETFFTHPLVIRVGTWLDSAAVGVGLVVFFKYVLPRLRENEKNKEYIAKLEQNIIDITKIADEAIQKVTGVNLNLDDKVNKLGQAFNIAFTDSGIGIKAKSLISSVLTSMVNGTPIDVTKEVAELMAEGKESTDELKEELKNFTAEVKNTALSELEKSVELALTEQKEDEPTEEV